jgi:hypothetical protein
VRPFISNNFRKSLQVPLLKPTGSKLVGPEFGHADAVTALVITDRGLAMSAGFDCALCVFSIAKPFKTLHKVQRAHDHGITADAHDAVDSWFVTGVEGAMRVCGPPMANQVTHNQVTHFDGTFSALF